MSMFLLVGCTTTQSAEITPKSSEIKSESEIPKVVEEKKEEKVGTPKTENTDPFSGQDIPPHITVRSVKPVICGEMSSILNNMYLKFGEKPIMVGESESIMPNTAVKKRSMVTLLHNTESGTFTFLEQMPTEDRLMCMLASGKAKLNKNFPTSSESKGSSL